MRSNGQASQGPKAAVDDEETACNGSPFVTRAVISSAVRPGFLRLHAGLIGEFDAGRFKGGGDRGHIVSGSSCFNSAESTSELPAITAKKDIIGLIKPIAVIIAVLQGESACFGWLNGLAV